MFARTFQLARSASFVVATAAATVAPPAKVARAASVSVRGVVVHYDWTEADYRALIQAANDIGANDVYELAVCLYGESNMEPSAYFHTPSDPQAIGLNQITPVAAKAMGITTAEWMSLLSMTPVEQLPYVVRSFRTAVGTRKLPTATEIYVANFAPGHIQWAGDPSHVLYDSVKNPAEYKGNKGLDYGNKGWIEVSDIQRYIAKVRNTVGYRAHADALAKVGAGTYSPPAPSPVASTGGGGGRTVWYAAGAAAMLGGAWLWFK